MWDFLTLFSKALTYFTFSISQSLCNDFWHFRSIFQFISSHFQLLGWKVTGTLSPEIIKNWTRYMKQWFSRHWTSGNDGQWPLRDKKQMRWALWAYCFKKIQAVAQGKELRWRLVVPPSSWDKTESQGRPKQLGFVEHILEESYADWSRDLLKVLLEGRARHRGCYPRPEKKSCQKVKGNNTLRAHVGLE